MKISLCYFAVISAVGIAAAVLDKLSAQRNKWRISEKALLCISALGGSFAMLAAMILIRHKTRHIRFMAGIPVIILIQYIFTLFIMHFLNTH